MEDLCQANIRKYAVDSFFAHYSKKNQHDILEEVRKRGSAAVLYAAEIYSRLQQNRLLRLQQNHLLLGSLFSDAALTEESRTAFADSCDGVGTLSYIQPMYL